MGIDSDYLEPARMLADRLDVSVDMIYRWVERRDTTTFPTPITKLGRSSFWDYREVEEWYKLWRKVHVNGSGLSS